MAKKKNKEEKQLKRLNVISNIIKKFSTISAIGVGSYWLYIIFNAPSLAALDSAVYVYSILSLSGVGIIYLTLNDMVTEKIINVERNLKNSQNDGEKSLEPSDMLSLENVMKLSESNNQDKKAELLLNDNGISIEPYTEKSMYQGIVSEEKVNEFIDYLYKADSTTEDLNNFVLSCLDFLNDGCDLRELIIIISNEISREDVCEIISLLVKFSPRGEELRNFWNNHFPQHQIKDNKRKKVFGA